MSVGNKNRKTLLILFVVLTFLIGFLPIGAKNIYAEGVSEEEQSFEQIELQAEVIWTNLPEAVSIPETQLNLVNGDKIIESVKIDIGDEIVKFAPVDKVDGEGALISYEIEQEPLENFETTIKDFKVENSFIETEEKTPEAPPVEEKEPIEEAPPVEEKEPIEEAPPVEEKEPIEEAPPVEEKEPIEEASPVEEKPVEEAPPVVEEKPAEEAPPVEEKEPIEESPPVVEEKPAEEAPPVEEKEPIEEAPPVEEKEPIEETPPVVEKPAEEAPPVVEEGSVEEAPILDYPVGPDGVIPSKATSNRASTETLKLPAVIPSKISLPNNIGLNSITSPTTPGQVTYDKVAVPVPGLVNTWDITLRIEGYDNEKSSDIVLVIDRSGSMAEDGTPGKTRMQDAKDAAKKFVDALKNKPNTRIALVSYASNYLTSATVTKHTVFLDISVEANRDTLNTAIDGLVALGGTNTQAGIKAADELFNDVPLANKADFNNLVLLSDGLPTESYAIKSGDLNLSPTNNTFISAGNRVYHTAKNITAAKYNYSNTAGNGTSETTQIGTTGSWPSYTYYHYNHSNSAISQAKIFKNAATNRTLWTVALETDAHGNDVLEEIATPGKAFKATTAQLNTIFQQIAGSINAAAKDIKVLDPMGHGFEIAGINISGITASQGTYTYTNGLLDWNVGTLFNPIATNSPIKYAEMTYRVSITDDILAEPVPSDGLYPTNRNARFIYKDETDSTLTKYFPIPRVNPIFMKVEKVLLDANGNEITGDTRDFSIKVLSSARTDLPYEKYGRYDNTFVLKHGQSTWTTGLRLADTYTVSEILPANVMTDYDVTITVNGVETNTFTVVGPSGTPLNDSGQNDIQIKVTNKEKKLGKLILKKILKDPNGNVITGDPTEFTFTITGPDGFSTTRKLKGGDTVTIPNLIYGQYTVLETDPTTGYIVTSNPTDGKVTLAWNNKEGTVTITNKQDTTNVVVSKVVTGNMGDQNKDFVFTATLTNAQGTAINFPVPPANSGYTVSGSTATFDLKHNENVTLLNLPIGSKITIVESNNAGYVVSVKKNGTSVAYPLATFTLTGTGTTIEFTNHKDAIIDTGIAMDSVPYMLILALLGAGGVGGLIWKRKKTEFD